MIKYTTTLIINNYIYFFKDYMWGADAHRILLFNRSKYTFCTHHYIISMLIIQQIICVFQA